MGYDGIADDVDALFVAIGFDKVVKDERVGLGVVIGVDDGSGRLCLRHRCG